MILTINNETIDNSNSYLNNFIENNKNKLNISSYIYADCINIYYNKKIKKINEELVNLKKEIYYMRLVLYGIFTAGILDTLFYLIK